MFLSLSLQLSDYLQAPVPLPGGYDCEQRSDPIMGSGEFLPLLKSWRLQRGEHPGDTALKLLKLLWVQTSPLFISIWFHFRMGEACSQNKL